MGVYDLGDDYRGGFGGECVDFGESVSSHRGAYFNQLDVGFDLEMARSQFKVVNPAIDSLDCFYALRFNCASSEFGDVPIERSVSRPY